MSDPGRAGAVGVDSLARDPEAELGQETGFRDGDVLSTRSYPPVERGQVTVQQNGLLRHLQKVQPAPPIFGLLLNELRHDLEREARKDVDSPGRSHVDDELFPHDEVHTERRRILAEKRALYVQCHPSRTSVKHVLGEAHQQTALDFAPAEPRKTRKTPRDETFREFFQLAIKKLQQSVYINSLGRLRGSGTALRRRGPESRRGSARCRTRRRLLRAGCARPESR